MMVDEPGQVLTRVGDISVPSQAAPADLVFASDWGSVGEAATLDNSTTTVTTYFNDIA